jgi:hypothetical protein
MNYWNGKDVLHDVIWRTPLEDTPEDILEEILEDNLKGHPPEESSTEDTLLIYLFFLKNSKNVGTLFFSCRIFHHLLMKQLLYLFEVWPFYNGQLSFTGKVRPLFISSVLLKIKLVKTEV